MRLNEDDVGTVGLVQVRLADDESAAERADRVCTWLADTPDLPQLLVLPELWTVGAFADDAVLAAADDLDNATLRRLARLAVDRRITVHAGSFPERHAAGVSNTSVVFGPDGGRLAIYRKIHLFGFDAGEAARLQAGTQARLVDTAPLGPVGLTTCYDLRFPELYRRLTEQGATAFVVAAGWPTSRIEHWQVLVRARAIEDQVVVAACNATGMSNGVPLGGCSQIVAADGSVLATANPTEETILRATVDRAHTRRWRNDFPALRDRRLT